MLFEATWQVFVLCCIVGMFLLWVMNLKKQIIALLDENNKLKDRLRDKTIKEVAGTVVSKGPEVWANKSGA